MDNSLTTALIPPHSSIEGACPLHHAIQRKAGEVPGTFTAMRRSRDALPRFDRMWQPLAELG